MASNDDKNLEVLVKLFKSMTYLSTFVIIIDGENIRFSEPV